MSLHRPARTEDRVADAAGTPTSYREFAEYVRSDLLRHRGTTNFSDFLTCMGQSPGFQFTFWLRLVAWLRNAEPPLGLLYPVAGLVKRHFSYKYGISVPASTRIEHGFYIGHFGDIVVNENSTIGRNCNISQGVTLGETYRGNRAGAPSVGDNVYIGPGAKLVGGVHVGSNVAVGANAVVTRDVPDNAVVGGVPAEILSFEGSACYVCRTW